MAFSARFWVNGATLPSTERWVGNACLSIAPLSLGMTLSLVQDEPPNPILVGLLGTDTCRRPDDVAAPGEQPGLPRVETRSRGLFLPRFHTVGLAPPKLPFLPAFSVPLGKGSPSSNSPGQGLRGTIFQAALGARLAAPMGTGAAG